MSQAAQNISTGTWHETPEANNRYATRVARCHGYDVFGQMLGNARWAADPHSWFRRGLGVVFVIVGIVIIVGWDKDIQTWILENSPIAPWELDSGFIPEG